MSKIRELMKFNGFTPAPALRSDQGLSLTTLQEEMNRLFNHFYQGMQVHLTDWDAVPESAPAINVAETANAFQVDVALPGMDPNAVEIEVVGSLMFVRGTKTDEQEKKEESDAGIYLRKEITLGSFERTIPLPATADAEKAKARFANGVLGIVIPKKAESVTKSRKVKIQDAA